MSALVYIIVLNYCSAEDTLECVEAIRKIGYPHVRLLVIDNGSPDGSGRRLEKNIPPHEFIGLSENIGYAGGNNVGLHRALQEGAEYVFIVNPDVRLLPDSIQAYVDVMESDASIGALNPLQVMPDKETIDKKFLECVLRGVTDRNSVKSLGPSEVWEVRSLFGASLMLSRSALERVGGFDPLYFAYGEEQDLCRRIRYHGLRLVVTSKSPVVHLRTREKAGMDDFRLFLRLKGAYLYGLKNPHTRLRKLLKVAWGEMVQDMREAGGEFNFRRIHYAKVVWWILLHLTHIEKHRRIEKAGRAYI
jgi:GT2 family glycosyltransferase